MHDQRNNYFNRISQNIIKISKNIYHTARLTSHDRNYEKVLTVRGLPLLFWLTFLEHLIDVLISKSHAYGVKGESLNSPFFYLKNRKGRIYLVKHRDL